jgi:hypothetical protein
MVANMLYKGARAFQLVDGAEAFGVAARRAAEAFVSGPTKTPTITQPAQETYSKLRKLLDAFVPDQSVDNIVGPGASTSVRSVVANQQGAMVGYLKSQYPPSAPADPYRPLSDDNAVSALDIEEFLVKAEGATADGFMAALQSGSLTPHHIAALQASNPHALEEIRKAAFEAVGKHKAAPLSVAQERQLGVLMGMTDVEGAPDFIRRLQEGYGDLQQLNKAEGDQGMRPEPVRGKPMASKPFWTAADEAEERFQR